MSIINIIKNILFKKKVELGLLSQDPIDIRDYQLAEIQTPVELPEEFDLRDKMTSVQRQNWGTCTSHMADGVKEFLDKKEYGREIKLSQKFIYHNTKKISGLWDTQGDYLRNAFKSVCQYGACLEESFSDIKRNTWDKYIKDIPSEKAYKEAEKYKGKTFWTVGNTLEDFRQAIFQNKCPIGFGMKWDRGYYVPANDGRLSLPKGEELGGHAVICVGWTKDKLWFRNSHGTSWGLNGYSYIPFSEFEKHDIWNAYVLLDIEVPETPEAKVGWVADGYLRKDFVKDDIVYPNCNLNLRNAPWGTRLKVLSKGEKIKILGERKKTTNITWEKVEVI